MKRDKGVNVAVAILNRIKWPISIGAVALILNLVGLPSNTLKLLLYKINLICIAVVFAHFLRKELYSYIDLEVLLKQDKKTELEDAIKFAGAAILIGLLQFAIILALVTGI